MPFKQDALDWLAKNGMLPPSRIGQIFEESQRKNNEIRDLIEQK